MKPTRTPEGVLPVVAVLGALVVLGAAFVGPAVNEGLRWSPVTAPLGEQLSAPPDSTPVPVPPAHPPTSSPTSIDGVIVLWIAAGLLTVAIAFLAMRLLQAQVRRRLTRVRVGDALVNLDLHDWDASVAVPALRRGLDTALAMLAENREPRDAITRAWLGLQDAAEQSGIIRSPAETPTEFTSRILGLVQVDQAAIDDLLAVYLSTRFGDHEPASADVDRARRALQRIAAGWNERVRDGR